MARLTRQFSGLADTLLSEDAPVSLSSRVEAVIGSANELCPGAQMLPLVAGVTDPGYAGKQNQDDYFVWQSADGQTVIMAVLDGHGRETGQMGARVAKESFQRSLTSPEGLAGLRAAPEATLRASFSVAHAAIEAAFRRWYEGAGWTVTKGVGREEYLVRQKGSGAPQCVHGGTTATVVVLLDGARLIVSNVGDSTALLCGATGSMRPIAEITPLPTRERGEGGRLSLGGGLAREREGPVPFAELSADHSPESTEEFERIRAFRPHSSAPHQPELQFVYDTLNASKAGCPPIFELDGKGGPVRTGRGSYYKNVRCEWASLVFTPPPPLSPFQNALAFTRSLGDLHLQTYGVTHSPEIRWMDVVPGEEEALQSDLASLGLDGDAKGGAPAGPLAVVLCSDGVWDNWKYEEVAEFAMDARRVAQAASSGSAEEAANGLMAANLDRARVNFGSSADNMTAICLYLLPLSRAAA